jgi:RND family efflux transporter MFP subunit
MKPYTLLLAAGAAVLAVGAAAGCSQPHASESTAAAATPVVAVAKAVRTDLAQTLTVTAEFRPFQEIDVHAKVAGYVKAIYVDVGDRVQAGQLLAVLEVPEMQDELRQGEAAMSRAQEEVNRAQADLERAESVRQVAHLGATRLESVMKAKPNLVAQQDIDEASGRDRVAEAQVSTAKAALASAHQQSEVARAGQQRTQTLFNYTRITAHFAGVVTHRYADTGSMIQAGTSSQTQAMPIIKLSQNNVLRLTIPVPESAVSRIRIGAPVEVTVSALRRSFPGTVARTADKVDEQTRTMHTEVDVKNPGLELVPGMYASVALTLASKTAALTVPIQALERTESGGAVWVVDSDGKLRVRTVTLGLESADRVEATSGLKDDELIVVGNRSQLKAGNTVVPRLETAVAKGAK